MIVFLLLIVVLLIGLTAVAVMGRIGGFMADPTSTHGFPGLPAGPLTGHDMDLLRFDQALRGYRMDQVDEVIDALSARVRQLERARAADEADAVLGDEASAKVGPGDDLQVP